MPPYFTTTGLYTTDYSEQINKLKSELKNINRLNKLKIVNNKTNFISTLEIENRIKELEFLTLTYNSYTSTACTYTSYYSTNNFIITTASTTNTWLTI